MVDVARRMADLEAQIPEQVEHVFGDALAPGGLLVGQQKQEIDVGARGEHAAPVAALGHDRHAFGGRRIVGRVDVLGGEIVGERDQGVLKGRKTFGAFPPVAVLLELALGRGPGLYDQPPHALDEREAKRGRLPCMGARKLGGLVPESDRGRNRVPVSERAGPWRLSQV